MNRNNLWKFVIVLLVLAWSFYEMYPPVGRSLVSVFQDKAYRKDANFNAIVAKANELDKERPDQPFANLLKASGTNDLTYYFPNWKDEVQNDPNPNRAILYRLQHEASGKIRLGLDLQGGTSFLVEMNTTNLQSATNSIISQEGTQKMLSQAAEVLRKRVDKFGVAEPVIQPQGENRILIQLPGLSEADKDNARESIQKAAFLEFKLVHENSDELIKEGMTEPGYEVLKEKVTNPDGTTAYHPLLVQKKAVLTGEKVQSAYMSRDPMGHPEIDFTLTSEGADTFAKITSENVGRRLAIILDGQLQSAPSIKTPIEGGRGQITGNYSDQEAEQLANVLENPLQAPVSIVSESSVDPTLGSDTVKSGVWSAIIGTLLVAGFMAVYYLFAGVVADIALITNIIILVGVMSSIGTTLTLPGIAGVVLTIGMAVDANVLIFERIREEAAKGKSLRGALAAGYDRAFGTIFDSHVTTLISSIILIYMGTGPIKGFGVTLTIGVAASLFTALVVTRLIFDFMLSKGWLKSLPMLHVIRGTKIDFMKWAKPAFIVSWTIIVVGLAYGIFVRGSNMEGIDFKGGDNITLAFAQRIPGEDIKKVLHDQVHAFDPVVQFEKNVAGGNEQVSVTVESGMGTNVAPVLEKNFPAAKFKVIGSEHVGPTIGKEIKETAILASIVSLFGILVYVAFRYEFSFAVGAVVAVIHDILMTIGCYCLTGLFPQHHREFNATMVAALLTIIGFSINDTIVIFDRIREDLKMGVRGSFKDLINQALNQTLSRTIITSGTVFLATMSLYLFGGGAINDFAFTFLVGIITGTYSSIYIATALVLWWHKGQRPKTASQVVVESSVSSQRA